MRIAPLLLHPLLEELFVGLENAGPVAVTSTWQLTDSSLTVALKRESTAPLRAYAAVPAVQAAARRLQLQYPGRHDLRILEAPTRVTVSLHLRL